MKIGISGVRVPVHFDSEGDINTDPDSGRKGIGDYPGRVTGVLNTRITINTDNLWGIRLEGHGKIRLAFARRKTRMFPTTIVNRQLKYID